MTPNICIDFWAKSAQGWIQVGTEIGGIYPYLTLNVKQIIFYIKG